MQSYFEERWLGCVLMATAEMVPFLLDPCHPGGDTGSVSSVGICCGGGTSDVLYGRTQAVGAWDWGGSVDTWGRAVVVVVVVIVVQ